MRTLLLTAAALLVVPTTTVAQHLVGYDPVPGPGVMTETQLSTVLLPAPPGPTKVYPVVPALIPVPPMPPTPGDATFDSVGGVIWFSDGMSLATMATPSFPPTVPIIPPFPIGAAALGAIGAFGPAGRPAVTGIAYDPAANVMYLTAAGGMVVGVTPIPGTPIVVPAFAPGFAMGPVSGLEWDGITGTLLSCDIGGAVFQFLPGGAPFAGPFPGLPLMPAPAEDVAIDKTGFLIAGVPSPSIYVAAGSFAIDVIGVNAPLPIGTVMPTGLAFLPLPADNMPGAACPCGAVLPAIGSNGPMVTGNAAFAMTVGGLPPATPVLMAYDGVFNAAFPLINLTGCGLGIVPPSATVVTFFTLADPLGTASWPLPLLLPPGLGPVFGQALFPCAVDPAGFTLTPMEQLWVCGF